MALYDYKCRTCENIFEEEHGVNEDPVVPCPECSGVDTHKYIGNYRTMPVRFKGTGWVVNDTALDAVGMPENIRNSAATKEKLKNL